jgi:hypothetical protein
MDYVRGPCAESPVDQLPRGRPPHRHGSAEGEGEEPPGPRRGGVTTAEGLGRRAGE